MRKINIEQTHLRPEGFTLKSQHKSFHSNPSRLLEKSGKTTEVRKTKSYFQFNYLRSYFFFSHLQKAESYKKQPIP